MSQYAVFQWKTIDTEIDGYRNDHGICAERNLPFFVSWIRCLVAAFSLNSLLSLTLHYGALPMWVLASSTIFLEHFLHSVNKNRLNTLASRSRPLFLPLEFSLLLLFMRSCMHFYFSHCLKYVCDARRFQYTTVWKHLNVHCMKSPHSCLFIPMFDAELR